MNFFSIFQSPLFRTLSIDHLQAAADSTPFKRVLGPISLTAIGIGGILGSAIYGLLGAAILGDDNNGAGSGIVFSFLILAVVTFICGLCYAEFASIIPIGGSAYTYTFATLGEIVAWIIGWDLLLEYAISNSVVAIVWAQHVSTAAQDFLHIPSWALVDYWTAKEAECVAEQILTLACEAWKEHPTIPVVNIPIIFNCLAASIVVVITGLLLIGIKEAAATNAFMVLIKVGALLFFVVLGYGVTHSENRTSFVPTEWSGVWAGASTMFFSYIGFDAVSTAAEEAKEPRRRNMLIGIIGSLLICTTIYIAVAWTLTGMLPLDEISRDAPIIEAVRLKLSNDIANSLAGAAGLTMAATLLVFQYGQIRILFSMSRDGLLPMPSIFKKVHPKYGTPHVLTMAIGALVAVLSGVSDLGTIAEMTILGTLMACALVCAGTIVLLHKKPGSMRFITTPLLPLIGVGSCLFLMAHLPSAPWERFGIWLLVGLAIYFAHGFFSGRLSVARWTDRSNTR